MRKLLKNLKKIEQLYKNINDTDVEKLLLKLAFLEFAGWIENSLDTIYINIAKNDELLQKQIQEHINKCYSFDYEKIKGCICFCIGINNCINIERKIKESDLQMFKSSLKTIKNQRNELAHNSIYGTLANYLNFSEIKKHLKIIYFGLLQIKKYLNQV